MKIRTDKAWCDTDKHEFSSSVTKNSRYTLPPRRLNLALKGRAIENREYPRGERRYIKYKLALQLANDSTESKKGLCTCEMATC